MNVDCNGCGTTLVIGDATRYATCTDCGARLEVVRSVNAIYTEVLDATVKELKAELALLDTEASASAPPPVVGEGESVLRLIVGAVLVAMDLYWWMTDPSLQSLYVRIVILGAGIWLILSGFVRAVSNARVRLHLLTEAKATISRRREELQSVIAEETKRAESE